MEYTLYTQTSEVWDRTIEDINRAKKSILLNNYIISDLKEGEIGSRIISALQKACKRGIHIELILDGFGSIEVWRRAQSLLEGMEVRFYNDKPKWKHKWVNILFRDHRKLTIIDGDIVHIGGVVFQQITKDWNDFSARIIDPLIAHEAKRVFNHHKLKLLDRKTTKIKRKIFLTHDMDFKRGQIYQAIMKRIKHSKQQIILQTPYLSIPYLLYRQIKKAVERGVEVTLLVPEHSDHPFARLVARQQIDRLRAIGVKAFTHPVMNHAKVVLVDDWVTFGSCNLDRLSLQHNNEMNIQSQDSALVADTKAILEQWKDSAKEITTRQSNRLNRIISSVLKFIV